MPTLHTDFQSLVIALFLAGQDYIQHAKRQQLLSEAGLQWFNHEKEIRNAFSKPQGSFARKIIPLAPSSGMEGAITGMWCEWDCTAATHFCRIEILIYVTDQGQVYGFRVDSPHNAAKHKYWHVQFTHKFSFEGVKFWPSKATWISTKTPAFPIPLEKPGQVEPTDAAVYAMLSLYGREEVSKPITNLLRSIGFSSSLRTLLA